MDIGARIAMIWGKEGNFKERKRDKGDKSREKKTSGKKGNDSETHPTTKTTRWRYRRLRKKWIESEKREQLKKTPDPDVLE
jgi:hypothetical protein